MAASMTHNSDRVDGTSGKSNKTLAALWHCILSNGLFTHAATHQILQKVVTDSFGLWLEPEVMSLVCMPFHTCMLVLEVLVGRLILRLITV